MPIKSPGFVLAASVSANPETPSHNSPKVSVARVGAIHRFGATLSASPNFGFELCLNKIDDADCQGLDLSTLRMIANGAEPVSVQTLRRFIERFRRYGFRPEAMAPVYGLAENAVGLAFPPLGRPPIIDRVDREALSSAWRGRTGESR